MVANAVEHYKDHSTSVFMAAINDGGNAGFCLCEKCLSWDKPEKASPYQLMYESGPFDYCSLSDRYVRFWNRIGKEFSQKCPGKMISVSGYGAVTAPPVASKIEYESILMSYVGFDYLNDGMLADDRIWWREWQKRIVGKMALRSNMLCEGYGLNYVYISQMGRDFNELFSRGQVYAVDNDSLFNYWGSNGLNYYMLYKLMWNPSLDVEKELDDYCRIGFGDAAPLVKQYFQEIEKITSEIAAHNWNWKLGILNGLPTIYTPKRVSELRLILEEARKVADGENAKRIEFLMEGLEYTKVISAILKVKLEGNKGGDYTQALDARKEFFKNQKFPFSASYPADKFWRSGIGNDLRK